MTKILAWCGASSARLQAMEATCQGLVRRITDLEKSLDAETDSGFALETRVDTVSKMTDGFYDASLAHIQDQIRENMVLTNDVEQYIADDWIFGYMESSRRKTNRSVRPFSLLSEITFILTEIRAKSNRHTLFSLVQTRQLPILILRAPHSSFVSPGIRTDLTLSQRCCSCCHKFFKIPSHYYTSQITSLAQNYSTHVIENYFTNLQVTSVQQTFFHFWFSHHTINQLVLPAHLQLSLCNALQIL